MENLKILNSSEVAKHGDLGSIVVKSHNGEHVPYREIGSFYNIYSIDDLLFDIADFIEDLGLFFGITVSYSRDITTDADEYVFEIPKMIDGKTDIELSLHYDKDGSISMYINHIKVGGIESYSEFISVTGLEKNNVTISDLNMKEIKCKHSINVNFNDDYKDMTVVLNFLDLKNIRIVMFGDDNCLILFECS